MPTSTQAVTPYIARRYAPCKQDTIQNESKPSTVTEIPLSNSNASNDQSVLTPPLVSVSTSGKKRFLIGFGIALGTLLVLTAILVPVFLTRNQSNSSTAETMTTTTATTATTTTATTATTTTATTTTATTTTTTATTTTATTVTTTTTTASPPNLLTNGGAETGSLSPWVAGGAGTAIIDNGSAGAGISPRTGSRHFFGGVGALNTLTQTINIFNGTQGFTDAQLDSGTLSAAVVFYQQSYFQSTGHDQGQVTLAFRALNGTTISTVSTPAVSCTGSYCLQSYSYPLPSGTRSIALSLVFIRQSGSNLDCYFDDVSLRIV